MSVDTLTYTLVPETENVAGKIREITYDVALSSGYPGTGHGYTLSAQKVGFTRILEASTVGANVAGIPYVGILNTASGTAPLLAIFTGSAEVTNNTDLHTITLRIRFRGN